ISRTARTARFRRAACDSRRCCATTSSPTCTPKPGSVTSVAPPWRGLGDTAAMRSIVVMLALAGVADANGRAPVTNGIWFHPTDPHALYVRSTFGLLISHDDGCTFDWICEDNIGYGGVFDPKYAIGGDGAIFAATEHGLRVSRDGGCSFSTATPDEYVDALDL